MQALGRVVRSWRGRPSDAACSGGPGSTAWSVFSQLDYDDDAAHRRSALTLRCPAIVVRQDEGLGRCHPSPDGNGPHDNSSGRISTSASDAAREGLSRDRATLAECCRSGVPRTDFARANEVQLLLPLSPCSTNSDPLRGHRCRPGRGSGSVAPCHTERLLAAVDKPTRRTVAHNN